MDDLAALRLQIEWGADEALEAEPVDRLRPIAAPRAKPMADAPAVVVQRATPAERSMQAAAGARTLTELRDAIAGFEGCALRDTAGNMVFAAGDPGASLLLIGDPPGAAEDRAGTPFAGPGGELLDRMLASIGLDRSQLLLTPLIPWRPPGDRPPSAAELALCLPFLMRLVALTEPRRLLLLGPLAVRALLVQGASRRRPRGVWVDAACAGVERPVPALPTFSPAELLRNPRDRRAAWADLRLLRRTLDADVAKI
jgi:uracil-DNA glycosylase family 4